MFSSFFNKLKNVPRQRLEDPVCGMEATNDITLNYKGETYAFCSEHCRAQFEKNPENYIAK